MIKLDPIMDTIVWPKRIAVMFASMPHESMKDYLFETPGQTVEGRPAGRVWLLRRLCFSFRRSAGGSRSFPSPLHGLGPYRTSVRSCLLSDGASITSLDTASDVDEPSTSKRYQWPGPKLVLDSVAGERSAESS